LLVDSQFDDSVDSADLRANATSQDWYESRDDVPELLTLNDTDVGGNAGKKAALINHGIAENAYLSQEFSSAQTGSFSVSFDIYVDRIEDVGTYDRTGNVYIGDDRIGTNAPTGTSDERFVCLGFYDSTPGTDGDVQLVARTSSTQSFGNTAAWDMLASGLSYDTWMTLRVELDVAAGTYDVYLDDVLVGDDLPKYNGFTPSTVTYISFVADSDARGDFYVDNVFAPAVDRYKLGVDVDGFGSVDVVPGESSYAAGAEVTLTAVPDEDYVLDHWEVDGVPMGSDETLMVVMNADREVIAYFLSI